MALSGGAPPGQENVALAARPGRYKKSFREAEAFGRNRTGQKADWTGYTHNPAT